MILGIADNRDPSAIGPNGLTFRHRVDGVNDTVLRQEHIAIDRAQLSWMCQTYGALGLPPIVRIPSPDPHAATMVLDGGAAGVV